MKYRDAIRIFQKSGSIPEFPNIKFKGQDLIRKLSLYILNDIQFFGADFFHFVTLFYRRIWHPLTPLNPP
jgi:hypothetical protein